MRRISTRVRFLLASMVVAAALPVPGAAAAFTPAQRAAMQQAIDAEMQASGYPGVVAGLWVPGRGSFVSATGLADRRTKRPLRRRDIFRVGSITKTFTATVVLQLVERGKLRLGDRLARFVEGIPAGRQITIRQLLNHTSGIPDTSSEVSRLLFANPKRKFHPMRVIRNAVRQKRYCRPGKCWHYSNTNYQLLGVIARQVTGRSMHKLYKRILSKVPLPRTSFEPGPTVPRPRANGYDRETVDGPLVDTTGWNLYWSWTAGAMTSTLSDLKRWGPVLATGRGILGKQIQRARLQTVPTTSPGISYGLGIMELSGFFGHDGAVPGYDSLVLYDPEAKATLVLLGNTAVEQNATKTSAPPTLLNLATCMVAVASGQPCP